MVGCQGTVGKPEVNGDILIRILIGCQKLYHLEVRNTLVKSLEVYRLLACFGHRINHITIGDATMAGMLSYLRTRAQLPLERLGKLNGKITDVEEMISVLSQKFNHKDWELLFSQECSANDEICPCYSTAAAAEGS
jgi:hypothetical protein